MKFLRFLAAALILVFVIMFFMGAFASSSLFLKALALGIAAGLMFVGILSFLD